MRLEACDVTFGYFNGHPVLKNFSLALNEDDFVLLLGPNGGGKSTALGVLAGFLEMRGRGGGKYCSGRVMLDGRNLADYGSRERARLIAVVPQQLDLALDFTVRELVEIGRNPWMTRFGSSTAADRRAVDAALDLLELTELANRSCRRLSGGERQRAAVAAALAQQPRFLLLDEPTSALDPLHALRLMRLLHDLPGAPGRLMITHDLQLAVRHSGNVALLTAGRLLAYGAPEAVLSRENLLTTYGCDSEIIHAGRLGRSLLLAEAATR